MMDSLRLLTLRHKDDVDTYYRRYFDDYVEKRRNIASKELRKGQLLKSPPSLFVLIGVVVRSFDSL